MKQAIQAAMQEYQRFRSSGTTRTFMLSVRAGWPDWYFLHDQKYYPVKAIWAKASGQPSPDFNTRDAKRLLENEGFGFFVFVTGSGIDLDTPPKTGMSELDEKSAGFGGGESEDHRLLKEWISSHPSSVGLSKQSVGITEYILPSGDRIDIVFFDKASVTAIEVKPAKSSSIDLNRGLFQCIKYEAVLNAIERLDSKRNVFAKLAVGGRFPQDLIQKANDLGVTIVDGLSAG